MTDRRRLTWLDVFTSTRFAGNGLAVVHDADGIDDDTMLRVARETDLSETAFVQSATEEGADYRMRIFTTMGEIRFAGHPSLGVAVAVARARGDATAQYVQQTLAGLQPIDVKLEGETARASMLQEPPELADPVDAAQVLTALGLEPADAHPDLPVQPVSTGIFHMMVPVRDLEALASARGQHARLQAVTRETGCLVLYAFVPPAGTTGTVRARGFFEGPGGVQEDPATGSAAGPLCAYLHHHRGVGEILVDQGVEMGRPSSIEACLEADRVRVSGDCVVALEGELLLS